MLEYIFKMKLKSDYNGSGVSFILFKLFSLTLTYNKEAGDHLCASVSVGPFETGMTLSIWRKLLP